MEEVQIKIDVTDWAERALRLEEVPQSELELVELATLHGFSAKEAAEIALAVRQLGLAPEDIIAPNKACLSEGGAYFVHHVVAQQRLVFERNGKQMELRQYTAVQSSEDGQEESEDDADQLTFEAETVGSEDGPLPVTLPERGYVVTGTPESMENAKRLLFRFVPGHVKNRLAEVWAAGGDHMAVLKELVGVLYAIAEGIPG